MTVEAPPDPGRPIWPLALAALILTILMRLLPLPALANFAPVGALSLYAGARLPSWLALLLPFAAMSVSDYALVQMKGDGYAPRYYVYACYMVMTLVGTLLRRTESVWKIGAAALAMNVMFFFVTNLFAWYELRGRDYEDSAQGAIAALIAGLSWHRPTFFSDVLFVTGFFGAHAWALRHQPVVAPEETAA